MRRRRIAVAALLGWLAVAVSGLALAGHVFSGLQDDRGSSLTEAARTQLLLEDHARTGPQIVVLIRSTSPAADADAQLVAGALDLTPHIGTVVDHVTDADQRLVADDGSSQLVVATLDAHLSRAALDRTITRVKGIVARGVHSAPALGGGEPLIDREAARGARHDLLRGEAIALPVALVLLVVIFGGLAGAAAPVFAAAASVGGALLVLWPVTHVRAVSPYAVNVVTMFGLALGIDYGLLLLARFREERHRGLEVDEAVDVAMRTAGRTVTFSGLTVIAALVGLFVVGDPLLTSLALGGVAVVALSVVAARTLVPAWLHLVGHRIPARRPPADDGRVAALARGVVRRPWPVAVGVTVLLLASALPVLHAAIVLPDQRVLPGSSPSRHVADVLAADYPGRFDPSITVAGLTRTADPTWSPALAALPGVTGVERVSGYDASLQVLRVHVGGTGQDAAARHLVEEVRSDGRTRAFPVRVTGQAAILVDYRDRLQDRLPLAVGAVLLTTLVLLFAMTGSVVVPVKAVVMGLLSLTATLGVMVWGFQDGHLAARSGGLSAEVPLVLFVFAFGLSLDYEAFLLGRVREVWLETADSDRAVVTALQRTAGVITSAALLVVVVFVGFATGDILVVREIGVGLAVAVAVDATIVRCLLVPAVMALLGRANWWAPVPLRRLHERILPD